MRTHRNPFDLAREVAAMLQRLSADHRAVLVLREIQGLSYDEIAKVLEVPVGTVAVKKRKVRSSPPNFNT